MTEEIRHTAPELAHTLAETAEALGISQSWLHSLIERRIIHGEKRGRDWWVSLPEVRKYQDWMNRLTVQERHAVRYDVRPNGMKVWPAEVAD